MAAEARAPARRRTIGAPTHTHTHTQIQADEPINREPKGYVCRRHASWGWPADCAPAKTQSAPLDEWGCARFCLLFSPRRQKWARINEICSRHQASCHNNYLACARARATKSASRRPANRCEAGSHCAASRTAPGRRDVAPDAGATSRARLRAPARLPWPSSAGPPPAPSRPASQQASKPARPAALPGLSAPRAHKQAGHKGQTVIIVA